MAKKGQLSEDMKRRAKEMAQFIKKTYPTIMKVEALNHFRKSFVNEGFTDKTLERWKKRTTVDKNGKDITRYKTNRVGKRGGMNKYGSKLRGRPILTGHGSGGNKLRKSLRGRTTANQVIIYTYKNYAARHNEGLDGMPKRRFMAQSRSLDQKIGKKVDTAIDKILK